MPASGTSQKSLLLGIVFLCLFAFGYQPVVNYFFYGGGWPIVQIVFIVIYFIGVGCIRRSGVVTWLKWVLCLAPVVIAILMSP